MCNLTSEVEGTFFSSAAMCTAMVEHEEKLEKVMERHLFYFIFLGQKINSHFIKYGPNYMMKGASQQMSSQRRGGRFETLVLGKGFIFMGLNILVCKHISFSRTLG